MRLSPITHGVVQRDLTHRRWGEFAQLPNVNIARHKMSLDGSSGAHEFGRARPVLPRPRSAAARSASALVWSGRVGSGWWSMGGRPRRTRAPTASTPPRMRAPVPSDRPDASEDERPRRRRARPAGRGARLSRLATPPPGSSVDNANERSKSRRSGPGPTNPSPPCTLLAERGLGAALRDLLPGPPTPTESSGWGGVCPATRRGLCPRHRSSQRPQRREPIGDCPVGPGEQGGDQLAPRGAAELVRVAADVDPVEPGRVRPDPPPERASGRGFRALDVSS